MNGWVDIVSAVNICSEIYCNRTAASAVCSRSQRFYHQHFSDWPWRAVKPLPPVTTITEAERIMAIIKIITPIEQLVGLRPSVHPHCVWRYPPWCMVRQAASSLQTGQPRASAWAWWHSADSTVGPGPWRRTHSVMRHAVITWLHDMSSHDAMTAWHNQ